MIHLAIVIIVAMGVFHVIGKRRKKSWQKQWSPWGYDESLAFNYNWWFILSFPQFEVCFKPYALRVTVLGWRKMLFWWWLCRKMNEGA